MYSSSAASLESDSAQPGVTLHPFGWLDDWLFFASDLDSLGSLPSIWGGLCEKANWRLHWAKTELLSNSAAVASFSFMGNSIPVTTSFKYLGCVISARDTATEHI